MPATRMSSICDTHHHVIPVHRTRYGYQTPFHPTTSYQLLTLHTALGAIDKEILPPASWFQVIAPNFTSNLNADLKDSYNWLQNSRALRSDNMSASEDSRPNPYLVSLVDTSDQEAETSEDNESNQEART